MKKHLRKLPVFFILYFIWFLSVSSVYANVNITETFKSIVCEEVESIQEKRFFFITSKYGFITSFINDSPLRAHVPYKVHTYNKPIPGLTPNSSVSTIIVQKIPTVEDYSYYLDVGIFHNLFNAIYRAGLMGHDNRVPVNIMYKIVRFVEGFINLILNLAFGIFENAFFLQVDNTLDQDILLQIDELEPITLKNKSQALIVFMEGNRDITVKDKKSKELVERFIVNFKRYRLKDKIEDGHYIYNIGAKNNYKVYHSRYTFQK